MDTPRFEPREYQITATLEGYEVLNRKINLKRDDTVTLTLTEKPLPRALRNLAGVRWRHESFSTSAELNFTVQGKISGTHRAVLGATVRDQGTAESFNPRTGTIVARFTASQAKPFYSGNVHIRLVDDDHLEVSWTAAGAAQRLVFERDKTAK